MQPRPAACEKSRSSARGTMPRIWRSSIMVLDDILEAWKWLAQSIG